MTIIDQVRSIAEWSKQTRAIAAQKYGAVYKEEHGGVPGYGVIEHPGARIFDLREAGWQIRTETRPTRWVPVAKPGEQLPLGV